MAPLSTKNFVWILAVHFKSLKDDLYFLCQVYTVATAWDVCSTLSLTCTS